MRFWIQDKTTLSIGVLHCAPKIGVALLEPENIQEGHEALFQDKTTLSIGTLHCAPKIGVALLVPENIQEGHEALDPGQNHTQHWGTSLCTQNRCCSFRT